MHLLIGIHVFHYFCHQKIKLQDKPNEHTLLWLFEYQFHLINNDLVASYNEIHEYQLIDAFLLLNN
jgi:hypothetical protein